MWHLYLPIAGLSINTPEVFIMGGFVGLLSGIFGVGGGFLMTPLLIMIGIPPTIAAASDSNQIVGASTSGTLAHYRLGNVDFKMGLLLLVGGIIGGTLGVHVIKILRVIRQCRLPYSGHLCPHAGICRVLYVHRKPAVYEKIQGAGIRDRWCGCKTPQGVHVRATG